MTKDFTYRRHKFHVVVQLNAKIERRINGSVKHLFTIESCGHIVYSVEKYIEDKDLVTQVEIEEQLAKVYIDEALDGTKPDERLLNLGFK